MNDTRGRRAQERGSDNSRRSQTPSQET
jgi:hypothetical protein